MTFYKSFKKLPSGYYEVDARYPTEFTEFDDDVLNWRAMEDLDEDHNYLSKSYKNKPSYAGLHQRWDELHPLKAKMNSLRKDMSNVALAGLLGTGLVIKLAPKSLPESTLNKIVMGIGVPSMVALPTASIFEHVEDDKNRKLMDLVDATRLEIDNARRRDIAYKLTDGSSFRKDMINQVNRERKAWDKLDESNESYKRWHDDKMQRRAAIFKKHGLLKNYKHSIDIDRALEGM